VEGTHGCLEKLTNASVVVVVVVVVVSLSQSDVFLPQG